MQLSLYKFLKSVFHGYATLNRRFAASQKNLHKRKQRSNQCSFYDLECLFKVTQGQDSKQQKAYYEVHKGNMWNVPSVKLSIGSRSFSVSGPSVWNALPDYLRNPTLSIDVFKRYLKNFFLIAQY